MSNITTTLTWTPIKKKPRQFMPILIGRCKDGTIKNILAGWWNGDKWIFNGLYKGEYLEPTHWAAL